MYSKKGFIKKKLFLKSSNLFFFSRYLTSLLKKNTNSVLALRKKKSSKKVKLNLLYKNLCNKVLMRGIIKNSGQIKKKDKLSGIFKKFKSSDSTNLNCYIIKPFLYNKLRKQSFYLKKKKFFFLGGGLFLLKKKILLE